MHRLLQFGDLHALGRRKGTNGEGETEGRSTTSQEGQDETVVELELRSRANVVLYPVLTRGIRNTCEGKEGPRIEESPSISDGRVHG